MEPPIIAATIAAVIAVVTYFFTQRQSILERKRRACAEAVADALAWLELPYRVRRRLDDEPVTLTALADRMHHLQERLTFHDNWLRIELPSARPKYCALVDQVKTAARQSLRDAWTAGPLSGPGSMNMNDVTILTVEPAIAAFTDDVRKRLSIWRVWE